MGDEEKPGEISRVKLKTRSVVEDGNAEITNDDSSQEDSHLTTGSSETSEGVVEAESAQVQADQSQPQQVDNGFVPPAIPTQKGPNGIRYDFSFGNRVSVPAPQEGEKWHIRIIDMDAEVILLDRVCTEQITATTAKRHFLRGNIIVGKIDKDGNEEEIFNHKYDVTGKEVLIILPIGSLGDSLGWIPYAVRFQKEYNCKLTISMGNLLLSLFAESYPNVTFINGDELKQAGIPDKYYASYYIGLFFDDEQNHWQPHDFRQVGLHRTAGYILGVDPTEEAPVLTVEDDTRPIPDPYVVIATQASTQCKYWNNPYGWRNVIQFLKEKGYRVICIDKEPVYGQGLTWNMIPHGVEDETGPRPLTERAQWLKHAEFFVGLSSGLAWLAWGAGIPVVVISGFTHPSTEFDTPYRVFSTHVCNSCWNDVRHRFQHNNFFYCPRHRDTPKQFECTRAISHQHVINTIKKIPNFKDYKEAENLIDDEAVAKV